MKNKKQRWIEAYEHTLNLYKNNQHKNSVAQCKKCQILGGYYNCEKCPESVFESGGESTVSCLNRNVPAENSTHLSKIKKSKLIQYHEEAINYLKSIKRFNMDNFKKELVRIDNQFAKK